MSNASQSNASKADNEDLTPPTLLMAVAAQVQDGEVGDGTETSAHYAQAFREMLYDAFGEEPATDEQGREAARQPLPDADTVAATIVGLGVGFAKSQADEGAFDEQAFMEVVKVGMYLALNFQPYLNAVNGDGS